MDYEDLFVKNLSSVNELYQISSYKAKLARRQILQNIMDKSSNLNQASNPTQIISNHPFSKIFSQHSTSNQPANSVSKPATSPFPPFQSTSLHSSKPPCQQQKMPPEAHSSNALNQKLLEGIQKYANLKSIKPDESRSDDTERKNNSTSMLEREQEARGFMAKKSSKSPTNETGQRQNVSKNAEDQSNTAPFNIHNSSTTQKLHFFANTFKQQEKQENKGKATNEPVIPCLNKGAEETAKSNALTAPSQQKMTAPTSFVQVLSTSSPPNPTGTVISPIKKGTVTSSNAGTPTFGTINQPTANPQQQSISPQGHNIFVRASASTQPQPAPQISSVFGQQSSTSQQQHPTISQNNQNIVVNQQNQGLFHPNSVPIMTAQQFHHKQNLLQVPKHHNDQILDHMAADFDLQNLTVDTFIIQCHDILKEVFDNLDYLAKQPERFVVQLQQNIAITNTLQELSHAHACSPDQILQLIYQMDSKQKQLQNLLQSIQIKLNQPCEQHSMSIELTQMMEIEEEMIEQELQGSFAATSDLTAIFCQLGIIQGQLDELNEQLNCYLARVPSLEHQ